MPRDNKIIFIRQKELIDAGRSLDSLGFASVNYRTFTVEEWEGANRYATINMGNQSSFVSTHTPSVR